MTEQIIRVDVDEAIKLAEAARAMLAVLKTVQAKLASADPGGFTWGEFQQVSAAIAQAEAAGIKEED